MTLRFFNWLVKTLGLKFLVGFSLLFLAVGSSAYAYADAIRQVTFGNLFPLLFFALAGSWLLARSSISGWVAGIILVLSGFIASILRVGELTAPLFALVRVFFNTLWQILNLDPSESIDLSNLSFAYAQVYSGVNTLFAAIFEWIQSLQDGLPLVDDIVITLLWATVSWLLASWAGWWLRRRRQPLLATLPIGIVAIAVLAYTWSDTFIIGLMLFATLLLFAYVSYEGSEEGWKKAKMDYPEDLPKEYSGASVTFVFAVVAVALLLPSIPFRGIIEAVSNFTQPQIEQAEPVIESFGLEQSSVPRGDIGRALRAGLPNFHLMGSGPELSEEIVMTVKISGTVSDQDENALSLPLYWRSRTYDEYFGYGWRSTDIVLRSYKAGEEVINTSVPYHQVIQEDFRIAQGKTRFLYAAGDIVTADDDFRIAYRPTARYTEIFDAHGDFFGASIDQNAYRVQSLIPVVSEEILRGGGEEYPVWVSERYLPLPDTIPARVSRLAEDLTLEETSPYDKVRTLESYLRGFEYSLEVELPPMRSDLVDYFLFDLQKGYCDYYATAMVVMARSLGIPSRLAVGYVRGTYDNVNNRYIVSEAEAHSWVEVYFPGIGWVPFEPTAGRAAISRFESEAEIQQGNERQRELRSLTPWRERLGIDWNWSLTLGATGAGVLLLLSGIYVYDTLRLRRMTTSAATSHLYQRLYRQGRGLKVATRREDTPLEFSARLEDRLASLSQGSFFEKSLQKAVSLVQEFTRVYVLMRYSPFSLKMEDRKQVIQLWKNLRRHLWLARLRQLTFHSSHAEDAVPDPPQSPISNL